MKKTTKITVEYDLKDIQDALANELGREGFMLESIQPIYKESGDDRLGPTSTVLAGIICHVKQNPTAPYGDR